ncbi:AMP-binding protein [Pseudoalteromonas tunicata]|uniref:Non-ribosomal peptide synthetase modules and related protein n=1 Tax=Pseudoalteromonas tunicata D2 TaxID=87626 RepID=A4C5W1_9GAMM|nr:AMP-binding protein [Pseudoalteromonas tunicata]ATC95339.1 hypothetical protein PTUN_a2940 [Pseudoalteromonas tunicata]AXT30930.1 peptide synthetase [Pseudoalteromonas tunicata]EAR29365.1 Non-ribosomal peptide synthetase modules and related protein [Pseudoalteromonas tunicata D2]
MDKLTSKTLHRALFYWAQLQPQQPFLLAEPALNYGQTVNYVCNLAQTLGQVERVAIWMDKSNHFAVAILACLTAGASYVPIDSKQPLTRLKLIVDDANVDTIIVDDAHYQMLLPLLSHLPELKVVVITDTAAQLGFDWCSAINTELNYEHKDRQNNELAAILFTSGSTGKPKGVQLTVDNLQHFVNWSAKNLALSSQDRFLNLASFNFDLSTFDLFVSLAVGASLYVASDDAAKQPLQLVSVLNGQQITVMYTVPSLLNLMNRIGLWQQAEPVKLRHVIFAGEAMPKPCLQALAKVLPNTDLHNFYGPTETNVCLAYQVTSSDLITDQPVPIGLPIGDTVAWLIDEDGMLIESNEGAIGELIIQGRCVTPGYCDQAQVKPSHAQHIHATGDIARFSAGQYYYHGRRDRMVKIAGFRVELGEIEACLQRHPAIAEVAVNYCVQTARLIATYVTQEARAKLGAIELKSYCSDFLPVYMIPNKFNSVSELPKNANGKVDYPTLAKVND